MIPLVAQGAAGEEQQSRTQPLAASGNDVLGNLTNKRHFGGEPLADHPINLAHVVGNENKGAGAGF